MQKLKIYAFYIIEAAAYLLNPEYKTNHINKHNTYNQITKTQENLNELESKKVYIPEYDSENCNFVIRVNSSSSGSNTGFSPVNFPTNHNLPASRPSGVVNKARPKPIPSSRNRPRVMPNTSKSLRPGNEPGKPNPNGAETIFDKNKQKKGQEKIPEYQFVDKSKSNKKKDEDVCLLDDQQETETVAKDFELPSLKANKSFIYNLHMKISRKVLAKLFETEISRQHLFDGMNKIARDKIKDIVKERLEGFPRDRIMEYKFAGELRAFVKPGKGGRPNEILAIFHKRYFNAVKKSLKKKYR